MEIVIDPNRSVHRSLLLVQNSADVGETGVEMSAAAVGTCKESLNRSSGVPARPSDAQVSALVQQKWSARVGILAEFRDKF